MRFEVGPVPMRAARRWLAHARTSVDALRRLQQPGIPAPVLDEFEALVEQWSGSVDRGDVFRWESFVPVERVRRLGTFWAVAARAVRTPESGLPGPPPAEARPFYEALVTGVTDALVAADEGGIGPTLRSVLPRFGERPHVVRGPGASVVEPPVDAKRVLVVEDTPDVRLLLRIGLRTYPEIEIVAEAADGLEALAVAADTRPDVVLLDLGLPRMSGLEALPHLRSLLPEGRIVAYSASREKEAEAIAAGADTFVLKGAALDELASALVVRSSAPPDWVP